MSGFRILAPIPYERLRGAIEVLQGREFALFGSDAFELFRKSEVGSPVLIYVSHDNAEPIVRFNATYRGIVEDEIETPPRKSRSPANFDNWREVGNLLESVRYRGVG